MGSFAGEDSKNRQLFSEGENGLSDGLPLMGDGDRPDESLTLTEEASEAGRPLTSVELLDAAIWREIGSEDAQPAAAFLEAFSAIVGRWLLVRSDAPQMDLLTVMCRARGYIQRGGAKPKSTKFDAPEWLRNAFDEGGRYDDPR
jgi:hypothetical protein